MLRKHTQAASLGWKSLIGVRGEDTGISGTCSQQPVRICYVRSSQRVLRLIHCSFAQQLMFAEFCQYSIHAFQSIHTNSVAVTGGKEN